MTVLVALGMGALGRRARPDDVVIGGVFAWILGLGVFFLTLYTTHRSSGANGQAGVTVLFGSIFGLSGGDAVLTAVVAAVVCLAVVAIARPLLFASLDEAVATTHGVRVRLLGYGFLVLVALTDRGVDPGRRRAADPRSARRAGRSRDAADRAAVAGAVDFGRRSRWPACGSGSRSATRCRCVPPSFGILAVATLAYLGSVAVSGRRRWAVA